MQMYGTGLVAGASEGWFKSSFSTGNAMCVEIRFDPDSGVCVRDSKFLRDPKNVFRNEPQIHVSAAGWDSFLSRLKNSSHGIAMDAIDRELALRNGPGGGMILASLMSGVSLTYTKDEWTAFLAGVRAGEFSNVLGGVG